MEKIDLIELYNTVSALLRKHHNGYMAPDIFNTNLKLVERELFNHFIRYYELKHIVVEHMEPFKRYEVIQTNHDGVMEFPDDHAYRIALEGFYLKNPDAADAIAYPCPYLQETQISTVLSSTVIAPSLEKKIFYHTFRNGAIAGFCQKCYVGENHKGWNKNKTSEQRIKERNGGENRVWTNNVYKANNYTCQKCGDKKGGNLNAHHIFNYSKYKESRFDEDNGITLCVSCHKNFHKKHGYKNNDLNQLLHFLNTKQELINN